eukprot:16039-Heterococcus_DN1.PRE.7
MFVRLATSLKLRIRSTCVPPKGKSTNVLMGMTVGRAVCPTAGTEGRATIPKFTTGSFTKIVNYRATGDY